MRQTNLNIKLREKFVKQGVKMMRYHSLAIDPNTLPRSLQVICVAEDDEKIMGISHVDYPIHGIQFHPESFLSENGKGILNG